MQTKSRENSTSAKGRHLKARTRLIVAVLVCLLFSLGACGSASESWDSSETPSQAVIDSFPPGTLQKSARVYNERGREIWLAEVAGEGQLWRCIAQTSVHGFSTPCYGRDETVADGMFTSSAETETTTLIVGWVPERLVAPISIDTLPTGIELRHLDSRSFSFAIEHGRSALIEATGHNGQKWELDWTPQQDSADDDIEWDFEITGEDFADIDS